ncbi:hypothetical protein VIGAN_06167600, partial [Vigna angularis var. angularis]
HQNQYPVSISVFQKHSRETAQKNSAKNPSSSTIVAQRLYMHATNVDSIACIHQFQVKYAAYLWAGSIHQSIPNEKEKGGIA